MALKVLLGPQIGSRGPPWEPVEMQILGPPWSLFESRWWGWGSPAIDVWMSPPGDSAVPSRVLVKQGKA